MKRVELVEESEQRHAGCALLVRRANVLLQDALVVVEERQQQRLLVLEAPVERALAHSGEGGELVHAQLVERALLHELARGVENARAVLLRVRALLLGFRLPEDNEP